jgi:hypothetical protein
MQSGIFDKLWIRLLKDYDKKKGIKWTANTWQYLYKITFSGLWRYNPTDRSNLSSKRYILTDKEGIPLSTIITSTITHYITIATKIIDNIVIKRPTSYTSKSSKERKKQKLCLDKTYHSKEVEQEIIKRGYIPNIRHRREEKSYCIKIILQEDGW